MCIAAGLDDFGGSRVTVAGVWHCLGRQEGCLAALPSTGAGCSAWASGAQLPLHTDAASGWQGNAEIPPCSHSVGRRHPKQAFSCLWHCHGSADGCPVLKFKTHCLPAFGDQPIIPKEADRNVGFTTPFTGRDPKASGCFADFTLTLFCHQSRWGLRDRLQLPPEPLKWAAGSGFSLVSELGEGK